MAARLQQLQSKACQATQYVTKNGGTYYKQLMEKNKQYVKEPATVETCNELSKQWFYTNLARLPFVFPSVFSLFVLGLYSAFVQIDFHTDRHLKFGCLN